MPERTTSGNNWRKMEKILDPKKNAFSPQLLFDVTYNKAYRLLRQRVRQTSGLTTSKTFSFDPSEIRLLAEAFDALGRANTSRTPMARSVARFFREGHLDRRIA